MAEGGVIKPVKKRGIHVVDPSHKKLLRLAPGRPGHELMRYKNISFGCIYRDTLQHHADGILIRLNLLLRKYMPDDGRLNKGQKPYRYGSVLVLHCDMAYFAVINRRHINLILLH